MKFPVLGAKAQPDILDGNAPMTVGDAHGEALSSSIWATSLAFVE